MRISIISNSPWSNSGYGNQTKLIAPRFKALGHEVSIQAFHGHIGQPTAWNGITVYGLANEPYGQDVMAAHAINFKADFILSNMDAMVIRTEALYGVPWVCWTPIDSEPVPPLIAENIKFANARLAFSRFGLEEIKKTGMDCDYVPYGVDTETFHPADKLKAKQEVGLSPDKFVVGFVGMNRGLRKAPHQHIEAFSIFHKNHPDSILYLHTSTGEEPIPAPETKRLAKYCAGLGLEIGKEAIFANPYSLINGYPEEAMCTLYNAMDVLMLVSMGEGFGLPVVEAQACGTPVIVGDWTSTAELCFSGWKVPKKETERVFTHWEAYQFLPHVDAIVEKLELAYQMRGNPDYYKRARDGAEKYDIEKIMKKYWVPELEKIEGIIKDAPKSSVETSLGILR